MRVSRLFKSKTGDREELFFQKIENHRFKENALSLQVAITWRPKRSHSHCRSKLLGHKENTWSFQMNITWESKRVHAHCNLKLRVTKIPLTLHF